MIILCSNDAWLSELCVYLCDGQNEVKQLNTRQHLKRLATDTGDLVIIDLQWCTETEFPVLKTPAMALTHTPEYRQAMRLLQRGVRGYGNRHMLRENFFQAVTAVRAGQVWLPPAIITRMITSFPQSKPAQEENTLFEPLSKREEEVVHHIFNGLSNKEVAEKMHIAVRTVKAHLTSIFAKTGYRDRLELAVKMKSENA